MRRAAWSGLCALLVCLAPPVARAAPAELVLSGAGSSTVDVVLRRSSVLELARLIADEQAAWSGVAVLDSRGTVLGASLNVDRWTEGAQPVFTPAPVTTAERLQLPVGRYRLVLLASGPARVRVPASGDLIRAVRTARALGGTPVRLTDLRDQLPGPAEHVTGGVRVRKEGLAILVLHLRATAHQASTPELCFRDVEAGDDCLTSLGIRGTAVSPGSVGDGYVQYYYIVRGDLSAGSYETRSRDVVVDVPKVLDELLVVL